jgi:hypothetical protein
MEIFHRLDLLTETQEADIRVYKIPWFQSASELYRPSDRRLSAKLVPTMYNFQNVLSHQTDKVLYVCMMTEAEHFRNGVFL